MAALNGAKCGPKSWTPDTRSPPRPGPRASPLLLGAVGIVVILTTGHARS
jgi:hypothetical protein